MEEFAAKEKLKDYENRISDWIGSQGIFFQLRYARTIRANSLVRQFGNLAIKLLVISALILSLSYFILGRYFESDHYAEKMTKHVQEAFGVTEIEGKEFRRARGTGSYQGLTLTGGDRSFFYQSTMAGFRAPLSYFTGLSKKWAPDLINIERLEINLKSGGEEKEMREAFAVVLDSFGGEGVRSIQVDDFSCDWGYSKLTYGSLGNTKMQAELKDGAWVVSFSGGTFQQNWIRNCEILNGEILINSSGLEVVALDLAHGQGSLKISGKVGAPIEKPNFDLKGIFKDLALDRFIDVSGETVREFLEGHISGDLRITGSTNSLIKVEGNAGVAEGLSLTIRERWPVLKAVSIMDPRRTFRRINFSEGGFEFTTQGGGLEVRNLSLSAKDKAKLVGDFKTRLPSQSEAARFLGITLTDGFSNDFTDTSLAQKLEDDRMSLRDAFTKRERIDDFEFDRSRYDAISREQEVQSSQKNLEGARLLGEMKVHRITGKMKLGIPESSFAENENLARLYPAEGDGWRWIDIPLENQQFSKISEEANERILEQARTKF